MPIGLRARVGESILALWQQSFARSLFVVGTGKNVGKTVTMRAIYRACIDAGIGCALASIGRDGEAYDVTGETAKPRYRLEPATIVATACGVIPRSPASEVLALTSYETAAGAIAYLRVRGAGLYELVGPPSAYALRGVVDDLLALAPRVLVDGAVDRMAALAGGNDAIVVACGAASAPTLGEAVDDVRALVARLNVARFTGEEESLAVDGALTATMTAELIRAGERRTIVVRDPTQIALSGKAALRAFERLRIRCVRPLRVIAATVATIGPERAFEPRAFADAVARATGLPTFDVYTAERAA